MRNFCQTLTLFYTFDFCKDKLSFLWRSADIPYEPCKVVMGGLCTYLACVFSYPWGVTVRNMVDFWPKDANGEC